MELLTVVREREQLWNFGAAPDDTGLLGNGSGTLSLAARLLDLLLLAGLALLTEVEHLVLEVAGLQAVSSDYNHINRVLVQNLDQLVAVTLMLQFFLGLRLLTHLLFTGLETRLGAGLSFAWGEEPHEVFVSDQLTVFVDHGHSNHVVVRVDLVHEGSHHDQTFLWLDDVFVSAQLGSRHFRRLDLVSWHWHLVEGSVHELFRVGSLAVVDHKGLSLLLELVPYFLDQFLLKNVVKQCLDDVSTQSTPALLPVRDVKVVLFQEALELGVLQLLQLDLRRD